MAGRPGRKEIPLEKAISLAGQYNYGKGMSLTGLAKQEGVARSTIKRWIRIGQEPQYMNPPAGAEYRMSPLWYKRGRFGRVLKWSEEWKEWLNSPSVKLSDLEMHGKRV